MNGIDVASRTEVATVPTDGELLKRFVEHHDQAAFAELVCRHGRMVFGVCRRRLGHPHDAEDASQSVFLALARHAPKLVRGATVAPWLYTVARQVGLKELKDRQRRSRGRGIKPPDSQPESYSEGVSELDTALESLPKQEREAIVLCHLEGMSRREAAKALRCAEGTLSSRLSRALQRLRRKLGRSPLGVLAAATAVITPEKRSLAGVSQYEQLGIVPLENWLPKISDLKRKDDPVRFNLFLAPAATGVIAAAFVLIGWPAETDRSPGPSPNDEAQSPSSQRALQPPLTPKHFQKMIDDERRLAGGSPIPVDAETDRVLSDWERRRAGNRTVYAQFERAVKPPAFDKGVTQKGAFRFRHHDLFRLDILADAERKGREVLLWTAENEFWHCAADTRAVTILKCDRSHLFDFLAAAEYVWFLPIDRSTLQRHGAIRRIKEDGSQVVLSMNPAKREVAPEYGYSSMTVHLRKPELLPSKLIIQRSDGVQVTSDFSAVLERFEVRESDFHLPKIDLRGWNVTSHDLASMPAVK